MAEPQFRKVGQGPTDIAQVDFQNSPGETLIPPPTTQSRRPRETNFFDDPFGDDPIPTQAPANQTQDFSLPSDQGEELIAPPARPEPTPPAIPNELRRPTEELPPNLFDGSAEPLRSPDQTDSAIEPTPPEVIPAPRESDPSLELPTPGLESTPEQRRSDKRPRSNEPDQAANELPPPPQAEQQENPFGGLEFENQARDQRDRDRLNSGEMDDDVGTTLDEDDLGKPEKLACGDFRQRIAAATIDKVSLDISPPYRPDEIDMDKFQELKEEFNEKQRIRDWRAIDGSLMVTGRLRDLAYENAVIEVEPGKMQELQINELSEGDLAYIGENWGLPAECLLEQSIPQPRAWAMTTMTWKASNLCHTPLYFEDVNLERYGHTHGPVLEPFIQSAHFFGNVLVLPYKMGVHSPHECQYALGYYRPGNCAPWIKQPVPISLKGALTQAVTTTGLFWLVP